MLTKVLRPSALAGEKLNAAFFVRTTEVGESETLPLERSSEHRAGGGDVLTARLPGASCGLPVTARRTGISGCQQQQLHGDSCTVRFVTPKRPSC